MNERFKQLMIELKKTVSTHRGAEVLIGYDEIEAFAELIVRECANIARRADLEDVDGGDSAVLRAAANQIKEHFGVEE